MNRYIESERENVAERKEGRKKSGTILLSDLISDLFDNNVINSSKPPNNKFIELRLNCFIMILFSYK